MSQILTALASAAALLALFSFGFRSPHPSVVERVTQDDLWPGTGTWALSVLDTLSLEQKVAQMFATHANGRLTSVDDPEYRRLQDLVENLQIGGVIFFAGEPVAQAVLTNDLQQKAPIPLLISQDMEHGVGMRLPRTTSFPQAMAVGATQNRELAYSMGRAVAQEARALGVHQNFAPVSDINNNPFNPIINVRSYGERADLVGDMNRAYIRGMQDGGLIATAKHFPGHGDTDVDSHADLPVMNLGRDRLERLELIPFRDAIHGRVMSVMTGHVAIPEIEPDTTLPATLSHRITTNMLRGDLGFDGIIVSDALNMAGVTKNFGAGEIAVRAVKAGVDMLLMSTDEYAAHRAIMDAVRDGSITEERIDASVIRILRAKAWLDLPNNRLVDVDDVATKVGTVHHRALNNEIARQSLTLLRNTGDLLPITDPKRILTVTLSDSRNPSVGDEFFGYLRNENRARAMQHRLLDLRSVPTEYRAVVQEADDYDLIIVPAYVSVRSWSGTISLPEGHVDFLNDLIARGTPVVLLSFGNPYIIMGVDHPAAYITAFGKGTSTLKAAAHALFGKADVNGRLPITIPDYYAYGEGISITQTVVREGYAEEVGLSSEKLQELDHVITNAINSRAFPGAAVAAGRVGTVAKLQGYGYYRYNSDVPVTSSSLFDMASLTKVIATTPAAMKLYEEGKLDLHAPVTQYLPEFGHNGKQDVTIWNLLTHTSGLRAFHPFYRSGITTRDAAIDFIMNDGLSYTPGSKMVYSDFAMITLKLVIERLSEQRFEDYVREQIFEPLGMHSTGFRPAGGATIDPAVVPTENDQYWRMRVIQGEVHDEAAYVLGGVAGHAGLFSNAEDLARFAQMMVTGGVSSGKRIFKPETIELFTTRVDERGTHTRALGWDTRPIAGNSSAGELFGPRSYGHTGFTGTSIWIDPDQQIYVILLTNRVYPTRENRQIMAVRPQVADIVHRSITGPPVFQTPHWQSASLGAN